MASSCSARALSGPASQTRRSRSTGWQPILADGSTPTDAEGASHRVAVSIGPEHGTVGPTQVKEVSKEAVQGVGFIWLVSVITAWVVMILAVIIAFRVRGSNAGQVESSRNKVREDLRHVSMRWKLLVHRWSTAMPASFEEKRSQLHRKGREYKRLSTLRDTKVKQLEGTARERQFKYTSTRTALIRQGLVESNHPGSQRYSPTDSRRRQTFQLPSAKYLGSVQS